MQRLEVSFAVRLIYMSLGAKGLKSVAAGGGLDTPGVKNFCRYFILCCTIWLKSSVDYVHKLYFVYFIKIDPVEATTYFVA